MTYGVLALRPIWANFPLRRVFFCIEIKTLHIMSELNFLRDDLIKPEKRLYFVVLYLLFYYGRKRMFCRDMGISGPMLEAWIGDKLHEAEEVIRTMKATMKKEIQKDMGIVPDGETDDTPTVESIKKNILVRLSERVSVEPDAAKLAAALKVLHKYDQEETEKKKSRKKSIYDDLKDGGI